MSFLCLCVCSSFLVVLSRCVLRIHCLGSIGKVSLVIVRVLIVNKFIRVLLFSVRVLIEVNVTLHSLVHSFQVRTVLPGSRPTALVCVQLSETLTFLLELERVTSNVT